MAKVVFTPFQASEKGKGLWIPSVNDTEYRVNIIQPTMPLIIPSPTMRHVQPPIKSMSEPIQDKRPRLNSNGSSPSVLGLSPPEDIPDDWEQIKDSHLNLSEFLSRSGRELLTVASSSFAHTDRSQGLRPPKVADKAEFSSMAGSSSPFEKPPPLFPPVAQPSGPVSLPVDVASTPRRQSDPPGPVPNVNSLDHLAPHFSTQLVVARLSPECELAKAAEAWFKKEVVYIEELKRKTDELWKWVDPYEGRGEMVHVKY